MDVLEKIKEILSTVGGYSVTQRIEQINQPRGGYIKPKDMSVVVLGDGYEVLNPYEATNAGLVGLTVDYMTRFMLGSPVNEAFKISLIGAKIIKKEETAQRLLNTINGLDNDSIISAVKLSCFDVCYRAGIKKYKPVDEIIPDQASIENIITMIKRSLSFFEKYGPIVLDGFSFEGGYTKLVSKGDGDFLTADTLWDFKVSKKSINKEHTLQLLMYWRMGLHSIYPEFKNIKYLGIFNPRMNKVYRIAVTDITTDVINIVERDIIGYKINTCNSVLCISFSKNDYPNGRRCLAILDSHPGPSKVWLCFTDGRKDKMYERTVTISDALIGSLTEILGEGKVTVR